MKSVAISKGASVRPESDLKKQKLVMNLASILTGIGLAASCAGQEYVIWTFAGGTPPPTPAKAVRASIGIPRGIATDRAGQVYFTALHCVFKVDTRGVLSRVAGNARPGYSGDRGPAASAQLNDPADVTVDGAGNIYVADRRNHRVRKVSPRGEITTVAGNGSEGGTGDGGRAASAQLHYPTGVAVDAGGNLYIADHENHRVRKVSSRGIITTVAGTGSNGYSGDGHLARRAQLEYPDSIAVDSGGNLYISTGSHIRKVSPNGIITTVTDEKALGKPAKGEFSSWGDPAGLAVDAAGNVYVALSHGHRIRKLSPEGVITTVAGNGDGGFSGDGGLAANAQLNFPAGLALDERGNVYVADVENSRIRKVSASGTITTVAGDGSAGYSGDGGLVQKAQLSRPSDVTLDAAGNVYIADTWNHRIRKVSPAGVITTLAGGRIASKRAKGSTHADVQIWYPSAVAVDRGGVRSCGIYLHVSVVSRRIIGPPSSRVQPERGKT